MKKFRYTLIAIACLIIIGQLTVTDYSDLSWSNNAGSYMGIISMMCVIIAMSMGNYISNINKNS